jgi:tRNA modification GTPase
MIEEFTICAISTATGSGGIAVIRISGSDAFDICNKIFRSKTKKKNILEAKSYSIQFGEIIDNEEIIDEVLLSIFKNPNSYTGEDTIEISCHGSVYIQQKILEILIKNGASLAKPGEFTQRAFLNGKLDLAQAEAVADLIASESKAAHRMAMQQMKGGFSERLNDLRKSLIHFVSLIELENDFAEEDVQFADRKQLNGIVDDVDVLITELIKSFTYGNAIKNGVPVAIVGRPNAGKSTLLNSLLSENRAIVSEIEGTTRDTIEEIFNINGIQFRFIDTAGLRKTKNEIEKIGVERALEKIDKSSIYIYLFDIKNLSLEELKADLAELNNDIPRLIVANKTDLVDKKILNDFSNLDYKCFFISAKNDKNLDEINNALFDSINKQLVKTSSVIVSNTRHYEALLKAQKSIKETKEGIKKEFPTDLIALDIRNAILNIGEITGEISNDEILGNIFGKFCIGK